MVQLVVPVSLFCIRVRVFKIFPLSMRKSRMKELGYTEFCTEDKPFLMVIHNLVNTVVPNSNISRLPKLKLDPKL